MLPAPFTKIFIVPDFSKKQSDVEKIFPDFFFRSSPVAFCGQD
jgi:hypothetical protein